MAMKLNPLTGEFDLSNNILQDAGANIVINNVPCDSSVSIGDWVIMDAGGTAQRAQADVEANSNVLGLAESKPSSVLANVRVLGVSEAIFVGLDVTKEYYLSAATPGEMSLSVPTGSGNVILKLGQPYSTTEFLVLKGQRTIRA